MPVWYVGPNRRREIIELEFPRDVAAADPVAAQPEAHSPDAARCALELGSIK